MKITLLAIFRKNTPEGIELKMFLRVFWIFDMKLEFELPKSWINEYIDFVKGTF
jgi:hypothetical protein